MKRLAIVFMAVLLVPSFAFAAPKIVFDKQTHDFGRVKHGDELEYVFEFTNQGNDPLIILKLESS